MTRHLKFEVTHFNNFGYKAPFGNWLNNNRFYSFVLKICFETEIRLVNFLFPGTNLLKFVSKISFGTESKGKYKLLIDFGNKNKKWKRILLLLLLPGLWPVGKGVMALSGEGEG